MDSNYPPPFDIPEDEAVMGDYSGAASINDNFKVVVRIRPPLQRELKGTGLRAYQCTTAVEQGGRNIILSENLQAVLGQSGGPADITLYNTYRFTFDHVYDQYSEQEQVYGQSAQQVVLSILQGYNAAIIAYGQTGTGKTFTMEGAMEGPDRGIIPRTVEDIFTYIVNDPEPTSKYLVRASYLQIYNEVVSDLLKPERAALAIREDRRRGVFVDGLSEWVVRSPAEVYQLMQRGQSLRATGSTKLNEMSSRSHAVCVIIVEKCTPNEEQQAEMRESGAMVPQAVQSIKVGKLNLVDLAGSERVHVTGAVGRRLEESKKINASLSALGNVIAALTDRRERSHIPYRDSKLTRLLEDSLGGNCRTTMIATIAPSAEAFQESLSTLKFANRAKNIQNEAHVNEDVDQRTLLRKYERELRRLRDELAKRRQNVVDKRQLLVAEEQAKRAEADKLAALTALQERSKEFLREKEEKRQLELKIQAMQSQLLSGGSALHEVPAIKAILQREQARLREHYESRIRAIEAEHQATAAQAAAAAAADSSASRAALELERYKELLLKQRDIMIALTARINEKDDQMLSLQEEVDALERYQRQLEDQLDAKTAELISLRKAAVEQAQGGPDGYAPLQSALGDWGGPGDGGSAAMAAALQQLGIGEGGGGGGGGGPAGLRSIRTTPGGGSGAGGAGAGPYGLPYGTYHAAVEVQLGTDSQDVTPRGSTSWQPPYSAASSSGQLAISGAGPYGNAYGNGGAAGNGFDQDAPYGSGSYTPGMGPGQQPGRGAGGEASPGEVAELRAAALTAAKERAALQEILDSRVRVMLSDLLQEVASSSQRGGAPTPQQQQLMQRLAAVEQLVGRVSGAISGSGPGSG